MSRTTRLLGVIAVLATPVVATAQSSDAIIQKEGASPLATTITFPLARDLTYRVAWGVNVGPEAADGVVEGRRAGEPAVRPRRPPEADHVLRRRRHGVLP